MTTEVDCAVVPPEQVDLATLLPPLFVLEEIVKIFDQAEAYWNHLPEDLRNRIEGTPRGTHLVDLADAMSHMHPDDRKEMRESCTRSGLALAQIIEQGASAAGLHLTAMDLELFQKVLALVPTLRAKSKRDVMRWYDAIDTGDTAYLVMRHSAQDGSIEIRYAAACPPEYEKVVGFPQPRRRRSDSGE